MESIPALLILRFCRCRVAVEASKGWWYVTLLFSPMSLYILAEVWGTADCLSRILNTEFRWATFAEESTEFPPSLTVPLSLKQKLRYGENPHQKAAFYEDKSLCEFGAGGIATAVQYHGKVSAGAFFVIF